jgi:glycine hydroxymethyltransferase
VTSGLRLGSPAVTTRGFGPDEMRQVAVWITQVLENVEDEAVIDRVRGEVREMAGQYPVPMVDWDES